MTQPMQAAVQTGGWRIAFDILVVAAKAIVLTILWTAAVEYIDDDVVATAIRHSWETTGHGWHSPVPLRLVYYGPLLPLALLYQGRSFPTMVRGRKRFVLRAVAVAVTAGLLYVGTISAKGYPSIGTHIFQPYVHF